MKCREAGGHLSRVSRVEVFVLFSDSHGVWLEISKVQARAVVDAANAAGVEPDVEIIGTTMRIGFEHDCEEDDEHDEPGPVCSECGEDWTSDHECPE